MSEEPRREPSDWERASRPTTQSTPAAQPLHYHAARHGNHVEESPELLRWRADLLMDEMMMGGVDVSAADNHRTFSGVTTPMMPRPNPGALPPNPSLSNGYDRYDSTPANGAHAGDAYANGTPVPPYAEPSNGGQGQIRYERVEPPQSDTDYANPRVESRPTDLRDYARPTSATNFTTEAPRTGEPGPKPASSHEPAPRPPDAGAPARAGFDRAEFERSAPRPYDYETGGRNSYERERRMDYDPQSRASIEHAPAERAPGAPRPEDASRAARPFVDRYVDRYEDNNASPVRDERNNASPVRDERNNASPVRDDRPAPSPSAADYAPRPQVDEAARYSGAERYSGVEEVRPAPPNLEEPPAPSPYPPLRTTMESTPLGDRGEQPPRIDRLYSVEQQYEQFRREQSTNVQPVAPSRPAERPPLPPVQPSRPPSAPPRVTPRPDEHTQWATVPDKWEYQDFSADPNAPQDDFAFGMGVPERRLDQESAVRQDQAQFVSAMSVFSNSKKRSTLLPRSTELDIDTLHREISDLHGEIAALLPVGNETSERARHLLDKAYSILQSDPSRSAEVEYYMQQVRTIVQRLHQSRQWSNLYRQRLHVYLLGWLGLSFMVLLARFAFQIDLEDALMWLFGLSLDSWVVAHWATFVGTTAAGAFGGALGALYTMQNHARGEHSFFDRKYGLRGLILPFMGLVVGALGYIIFGLIFALVGINPSQSLTAAIVPTMAALAFGFSQESIYGTRN